MSTLDFPRKSNHSVDAVTHALATLADEALVLGQTLLNPGPVIADVEQMQALWIEAERLAATDPEQAEALRRRASRIGLR